MTQTQEMLRQAVNEGLLALGEPIMKTITWHLRAHGIFLDSDNKIEIRALYEQLEQIVGNVADVVMEEVYSNLNSRGLQSTIQIKSSDPAVIKIERLLKVGGVAE